VNVFDNYTVIVLKSLIKHSVRFIVVGGYAVNYYGYRRTTGDIDIWLEPSNGENKTKLLAAFREIGIPAESIQHLADLNFETPQVFMDGVEPQKIDFMTSLSGVNFDEAWIQKKIVSIDELDVPFINYQHLIISKISTERVKDKLDVEQLQKINKNKSAGE
jgi:hypothetical protein